jgi:hypothetical protein
MEIICARKLVEELDVMEEIAKNKYIIFRGGLSGVSLNPIGNWQLAKCKKLSIRVAHCVAKQHCPLPIGISLHPGPQHNKYKIPSTHE